MSARKRRRMEGVNPFIAAGLIKFSEETEMFEKIKVKPITVVAGAMLFAIVVLLARVLLG